MKRIISKFFLLALLMAGVCACNGNNPDKPKVDYDKMIGTWTLNSYSEKWVNKDTGSEEKNRSVNKGTLTIRKEKTDDEEYYYYTENFVSEDCKEYSGRIDFHAGYIYLYGPDGMQRGDGAPTYDYTVSFPADGKMEWTYDWTGTHSDGSMSHTDHRTANAKFTKQ